MNTRFQSALNHIKADDALISKTEVYLRDKLEENQKNKVTKLFKPRFITVRNLAKAACIVFILTGGSNAVYGFYKTPVSYLSLDINPSIEIGVNAFDRVVTAEGYNSDGKTVLKGLDVTGCSVTEAVGTVISSAALNGFIDEDGSTVVSVTSETNNGSMADKLESEAEAGVNNALKEKEKKAVVLKGNVPLAFRAEAREQNITPGKLKLIKEVQEVNPAATVDQYKDDKVKNIVSAINQNEKRVSNNKLAASDSSKNINETNNRKSTIISDNEASDKNDKNSKVNAVSSKSDDNTNTEAVISSKNTDNMETETVINNKSSKEADRQAPSINNGQNGVNDNKINTSDNEIIKRHTKNNKNKK